MAKIKHTKTELKAQRESLQRFQRFLPMLQLKKQQLQVEIQQIDTKVEECDGRYKRVMADLQRWVKLFAEERDYDQLALLREVVTTTGNIAGVNIPIFQKAEIERAKLDLFETPAWLDDAQSSTGELMGLRAERDILAEQRRLIAEELRTTSQRVNLFEKVKIPECLEHIRVIKIFLGDEQTAAVARGKMAKKQMAKSAEATKELAA
jgi:V/A-type H+-transporting ATPase subunit D